MSSISPSGISNIASRLLSANNTPDARKTILLEGFNNINHGYISDHLVGTYSSTTVPQGSLGLLFTNTLGTSVTITSLTEGGVIGLQRLTSGSANSNAGFIATSSSFVFNTTSVFSCRFRFRLPFLPTPTENYNIRLGFQNNPNSALISGVSLLYDSVNSVFKGAIFKNNDLYTTNDSISLLANTFYDFEIVILNQNCYFFINSSLFASSAAVPGFPNGEILKLMAVIIKQSGTRNHQIDLDYISYGWGG